MERDPQGDVVQCPGLTGEGTETGRGEGRHQAGTLGLPTAAQILPIILTHHKYLLLANTSIFFPSVD